MTRAAQLEQQRATCQRKASYLSRRLAENAAWLIALHHHDPEPMSPYRCPVCPDWHLTSHPREEATP